jgi:hypothetical protein
MSDIQHYRPRAVSRVSRELNRISDAVDIQVATTIAKTEVELGHLDGLQAITGRAMQGVAMVTQLEQQLSAAVPLAASRLQAIGDMHALASADVVASAGRRLR